MDRLDSIQRQVQDLVYDFQRSVRSLSSLIAANESNLDATVDDVKALEDKLGDLTNRLTVLETQVRALPAIQTAANDAMIAARLAQQRVEDRMPVRQDQTPMHVPLQHQQAPTSNPAPATPAAPATPSAADSPMTSAVIIANEVKKWSPHATAVVALIIALVERCSPPTVERTDDGHTRVVFPVAQNQPQPPSPAPSAITPPPQQTEGMATASSAQPVDHVNADTDNQPRAPTPESQTAGSRPRPRPVMADDIP